MIKIYAIVAVVIIALSGVVWAQHQRVSNLRTQRDTAQMELTVMQDLVQQVEREREETNTKLLQREQERRLLYAEVNALKKRVIDLQDVESVDWLAAPVPDNIRLLRENRVP